jgi:hypothetical protein
MATLKARAMLLRIGGSPVVIDKQIECELNITQDVSETTTKASANRFKTFQEDFIGATASVSGLLDAAASTYGIEDFFTDMKAQAAAALLFSTGTSSDITWAMNGIITNMTLNFPKDGPGTFSASFQITGEIVQGTVGA